MSNVDLLIIYEDGDSITYEVRRNIKNVVVFNEGTAKFEIDNKSSIVPARPTKDLPINLSKRKGSKVVWEDGDMIHVHKRS